MEGDKQKYISLNGQLLPADEPHLDHHNRSFSYGDGLFETIHANGVNLHFFPDHFKRLTSAMIAMKMEIPRFFSAEYLENELAGLIKRNRMFTGNRIRLSVFRNPGGAYTPENNSVSWLAEVNPLPDADYKINEKGLKIDTFPEIKKPVNLLSAYKTCNALIYTMAGLYKTDHMLDDCLIVNEKGNITEAISSNIFLVKNNSLHTPPASEGPILGIIRKQIIALAPEMRLSVFEQPIKPGYLLDADECFLTNTITGIRWVMGYRHKRYYSRVAQELLNTLNKRMKMD